jgi:hypothetical protein
VARLTAAQRFRCAAGKGPRVAKLIRSHYYPPMPIDMNVLARLGAQTRITALIAEIEFLVHAFPDLGKAPAHPAGESEKPAPRKRRRMSATTKAKITAAWATRRGETATEPAEAAPLTEPPEKKRRKMSDAGKASIAAAQRKRWAAIRKAKKR